MRQPAVHHPDVGDDTTVGVIHRVEDQGTGWRIKHSVRRRHLRDHFMEQCGNAIAGLGGNSEHIRRLTADDLRQFLGVFLRLSGRQVDLVKDRDQVQVSVEGKIQVSERLSFNPLRGVDKQNGTFTGRK